MQLVQTWLEYLTEMLEYAVLANAESIGICWF